MAYLDFHPISLIFTYFHAPHVLFSGLISSHYGNPQCGHYASASVDLHLTLDVPLAFLNKNIRERHKGQMTIFSPIESRQQHHPSKTPHILGLLFV